ncbi:hypothetical protein D5S17_14985 [Pseudonocardiaceae bacterium YIM PH 21723]|nr:hypothetical protein D5S17_14985 [Pseudonocardiaceae bacterium YIM PH 21723]
MSTPNMVMASLLQLAGHQQAFDLPELVDIAAYRTWDSDLHADRAAITMVVGIKEFDQAVRHIARWARTLTTAAVTAHRGGERHLSIRAEGTLLGGVAVAVCCVATDIGAWLSDLAVGESRTLDLDRLAEFAGVPALTEAGAA